MSGLTFLGQMIDRSLLRTAGVTIVRDADVMVHQRCRQLCLFNAHVQRINDNVNYVNVTKALTSHAGQNAHVMQLLLCPSYSVCLLIAIKFIECLNQIKSVDLLRCLTTRALGRQT